jgi:RNA polymerase sigma-70 factor (ECF subfamily)
LDQKSIIKACIAQSRKAQQELYNQYKQTLFVLCLKYCSNSVDAEDVLHNSFIEIFTNIKNYNNKGSFDGWIKKITIHKAIDSFKKSVKLIPIKDNYDDEITIDDHETNLSLNDILLTIQELPTQYRLVFNLYELDDYSHQEIASMLQISENTSKSNLHRAKVILKEKITAKKLHNQYKNG